jgi:hypothetical protein
MLKKINLGLAVLVLGFGLVFTQSAFTVKDTAFYHYKSGPVDDTDSWEPAAAPGSFECPEGADVPCIIGIETPLATYLSGKTNSDILASNKLVSARAQ